MSTNPAVLIPDSIREAVIQDRGAEQYPRWVLEAVVVEAVREGMVSTGRARELLSLEIGEFDRLLAERGVLPKLSDYDFARESEALRKTALRP